MADKVLWRPLMRSACHDAVSSGREGAPGLRLWDSGECSVPLDRSWHVTLVQ